MDQIPTATGVIDSPETLEAASVTPVSPDEAAALASVQIERLLALLEQFDPADWEKPTYCSLWNVRQVVAHLAGALGAYADWERLLERSVPWTQGKADQPDVTMPIFLADLAGVPVERWKEYRQRGFVPLDALNQFEVDQRAHATPASLIAELRAVGLAAIANRLRLPDAVRSVQLPVAGVKAPVRYLLDVIYPRDMWMHRMELALATGRPIIRTTDHEGRLTALVMRDLSLRLNRALVNRSIVYRLAGPDGGVYHFGPSTSPEVVLAMDCVEFHLLASGRKSAADVRRSTTVVGDEALAERVLTNTIVTY